MRPQRVFAHPGGCKSGHRGARPADPTGIPTGAAEPPPQLAFGTLSIVLLLMSVLPNHWTKRAAERHDLRTIRKQLKTY